VITNSFGNSPGLVDQLVRSGGLVFGGLFSFASSGTGPLTIHAERLLYGTAEAAEAGEIRSTPRSQRERTYRQRGRLAQDQPPQRGPAASESAGNLKSQGLRSFLWRKGVTDGTESETTGKLHFFLWTKSHDTRYISGTVNALENRAYRQSEGHYARLRPHAGSMLSPESM
jgi:hypothetical protein